MNKKQTQKRHTAAPKSLAKPASVVKPTKPVEVPTIAVAPAPVELIAALRSPSVETAVDAAAALAKLGDARCVDALLAVLANADGYCHVVTRAAAAMALGRFDEARVIAALTAATQDTMAEVSREAVLALGELSAAQSVPALIAVVENASGFYAPTVRHAAVRTLGRLKASASQPVLARVALNPAEDTAIVAAAREALGQM